ncbi:MAG: 2Fe-2S iron-sulfur cluster-binding protein, partial [Marmoricola sp.]
MTTAPERAGDQTPTVVNLVTVTIDGIEVSVPEGTLVIRAAEQIGVQIPRFCDHPLLDPVGASRQCLVDVPDAGNGRPMPKPQASCTLPVAPGMVVNTQATSPVAAKAQQGILEFLLINHPLDCPVCDKGGECPLQNQALSNGPGESRFIDAKRLYPKPIHISAQVLLDRERCVLCARCTRFSEQVAGDPFIALVERGALQQVGIYEKQPFDSYFSGNTIQICPVGALTSVDYRFRARPFDLVSTPGVGEHDACGAAIRVDHRRGKVMRRLSGEDPEVNEEWISDKDRFAFRYA